MEGFRSVCLLLGLTITVLIIYAKAVEDWDWIIDLKNMNGSEFKDTINPIIQMAANAYRYPSIIEIPGWSLTPLVNPVAPSHGGVHALAYIQPPNKVIIAFRGTQIGNTQDCLSDLCADMILWDAQNFESLPANCSIFTFSTLDYFSQALDFTKQVMDAHPGYPLLLTGHSLGAGLAVMVSAALSDSVIVPVIGFGPPGTKKPIEVRSLHLKAAEEGKVILVANEWDEITRSQWDGQVGTLCMYQTVEPEACKVCFSTLERTSGCETCRTLLEFGGDQGGSLPEGDCMTCFMQTHVLKTLIRLVVEGSKPVCQERFSSIQVSQRMTELQQRRVTMTW